jgi:hypothetical protein
MQGMGSVKFLYKGVAQGGSRYLFLFLNDHFKREKLFFRMITVFSPCTVGMY